MPKLPQLQQQPISSFTGEYRFLSNFYTCDIFYEGIWYPSSEHAFQAAKTFDPLVRYNVSLEPSPMDAKRAGRSLCLRSDWETVKLSIMYSVLLIKFSSPYLRNLLLNTGNRQLIEGNTWGDRFWGVCEGKGSNQLGHLLMLLRKQLSH